MNQANVTIIVLAAGTSRRLGRPKQFLELGGEPLIRHTVRHALASKAGRVVVVVGNQAELMGAALDGLDAQILINPNFADGQSTSMVAGLAALTDDTDAAIMMLGDQPTVLPSLLDALIDAYTSAGAPIVQPVFANGMPGNPVLFDRSLFAELMQVTGDKGARDVIKAHSGDVHRVTTDAAEPPDVDTDQDYQSLLAAWQDITAAG